jgi:SAM-dependent methyltransferase
MTVPPDVPPPIPPASPPDAPPRTGEPSGQVGSCPPKAGRPHEHAAKRDWPAYFKAVEGKPARDTLLKALDLFEKDWAANPTSRPADPFAIDLGCGTGRDTAELLRRGWRVLAIDSTPLAIELLRKDLPPEYRPRVEMRVEPFEKLTLPRADLVNASYSIPFCDPDAFPRLWTQILGAIPVGARFAGQFFGPRDDWAELSDRAHHSRSQVDGMLAAFTLESLQEVESREAGVTGEIKNWHIFHVVAKRRA